MYGIIAHFINKETVEVYNSDTEDDCWKTLCDITEHYEDTGEWTANITTELVFNMGNVAYLTVEEI